MAIGFSQNSELIILQENDTLKTSEFDLFVSTKKGLCKINKSDKLLYQRYKFKNNGITSIYLVHKKDTLIFFGKTSQKLTFKKDNYGYESLNLSFEKNGGKEPNFDYKLCKNFKFDIIINLTDNDFKKIYKGLIIDMENPKDKDIPKHKSKIAKKEFKQRKKELKKYFKMTDFATLVYGNNIGIAKK